MLRVLCVLVLAAFSAADNQKQATQPHILMVLGDDIGFGNVGWNRDVQDPEVQTPNLNGLVARGIQLTAFYTFKYCSPTRSALQSHER